MTITDRPEASRYEARLGADVVGFVSYRWVAGRRVLLHTEVPREFSGRGIGAALARHILEAALATGIGVTVKCPFIRTYLERHPEYAAISMPLPTRPGTS